MTENNVKDSLVERCLQAMAQGDTAKANLFMFRVALHIEHDALLSSYGWAAVNGTDEEVAGWFTDLEVFYHQYPIMEPSYELLTPEEAE